MKTKYKASAIAIIIASLFVVNAFFKEKNWTRDQVIVADVSGYYSYLTATFIHHDIDLKFIDNPATPYVQKYIHNKGPHDSYVIKYTCGMAVLYSPFFAAAHFLAPMLNQPADGYSDVYEIAIEISSFLFLLLGLLFLRKTLQHFKFDEYIIACCIFTFVIGTNLFFYATFIAGMSHAYSFCLFSIFIWLVICWHHTPTLRLTLFIGLTGGLIILIRPTNAVIFLLFFLYRVNSFKSVFNQLKFFLSHFSLMFVILICILIVFSPQLFYWKHVTGSWIYDSYTGEKFFPSHPHYLKGLFGYRNGWLLYTPVMLFAIAGIALIRKFAKEFSLGVIIFCLINTTIILSWWCWWYVGFGHRAFIESYALMALPFCSFFQFVKSKTKVGFIAVNLSTIFFIYLNQFQFNQAINDLIHFEAMTKTSYWAIFMTNDRPPGYQYTFRNPHWGEAMENGVEKDE